MAGLLPGTASAQDEGRELFRTVVDDAKRCLAGKSRTEQISCYVKASPAKCESHVYEWVARRGAASQRAWYLCVASCADAGFLSRSFGSCARDRR